MKKIFVVILLLFTFIACSDVTVLHNVAPVSASQRTVILKDFPREWEDPLEKSLENYDWEVFAINNGHQSFVIEAYEIYYKGIGFTGSRIYEGKINIYDLRTRKRIIEYNFYDEYFDIITDNIIETMEKLKQ